MQMLELTYDEVKKIKRKLEEGEHVLKIAEEFNISRKVVTNVEPPNNEFWFLALEGYSGEDVQALIDSMNAIITGTQQVGNAKTLDGHGVEYFAPLADLERYMATLYKGNTEEGIDAIYDSLHTNASNGEWYRARVFHNVLHSVLGGGTWYVEGYRQQEKYGWQSATCYHSGNIVKTFKRALINSTTWSDWIADATTSDLANYLPLTGGTVATDGTTPLRLKNNTANVLYLQMLGASGVLGYFAMNGKDKPSFISANGAVSDILHTGNKPTGTYTGNGDATERTIATGGIGNCVVITNGSHLMCIVFHKGAICRHASSLIALTESEVSFENGILTLSTANDVINANGATFYYQVL